MTLGEVASYGEDNGKKNSVKSQLPVLPEAEEMSALDPQKELGRILQHPPHQRTQAPPTPAIFPNPSCSDKVESSVLGEGGDCCLF